MKELLCLILFTQLAVSLSAQKEDANWVFGENAGINFSDTAHVAVFTSKCHNPTMSASISDTNGNLLFYLAPNDIDTTYYPDGVFNGAYNSLYSPYYGVYGANGKKITNGDSIFSGYNLSNGSIIISFPGNLCKIIHINNFNLVSTNIYGVSNILCTTVEKNPYLLHVVKKIHLFSLPVWSIR